MKHFLSWFSMLLSLIISSVQAADMWLWKVQANSGAATADWILSTNNGTVHGSSYWHGSPVNGTYDNIDRVIGTVSGDTVSITRYLSASELVGKTQTFTGTINGTNISGSWNGIGCTGLCPWTATITPLTTSATTDTCPTPPACPITCPVTPGSDDCTAVYNADTGRFTAPCVAVPVVEPFVGKKILNYSIEMQQRTDAYTFDLDLDTVKQR